MASSSMPSPSGSAHYYIGCKISLISKSDIRYEGILYTLDQAASTVALSNVNSFGTEDRRKDNVIPARDQTYEYILFRGSDIKDIVVCEPPRLDLFSRRSELSDPAILEVTTLPAAATGAAPVTHPGSSLHAAAAGPAAVHDYAPPQHAEDRSRNYTASNPGRGGYRGVAPAREGGYRESGFRSDSAQQDRGGYRSGNQDGYGYRNQERGYDGGRSNYDDGGYRPRGGRYNNSAGYPSRNFGASQPRQSTGRRNDSYNQNSGASGTRDASGTPTAAQTKNLPDYDFETAEKVFHELESQAKKLNLNDVAGEGGAASGSVKKEEDTSDEPTKYYDPNSFFDKISCEALEKEKNPGQRPDWKRERQVNSETFGFTGFRSRNFSGGHQGRGGYRGYSREGGYRNNNQQEGGYYRSSNQDGGYRNQEQRGGGGYDAGRSNYEDGGYRPRGGMRYNNSTSYPSRNFGPSQRQTQTAGWNARPEDYFRCPDSPQQQRRRRLPSVHFEHDDRDFSFEDAYPADRAQAGGRRRRNRGGRDSSGARGGEDVAARGPTQPKTARPVSNQPRSDTRGGRNDDQAAGPKRRTVRNRSRGAGPAADAQPRGSTAAVEGGPAPASASVVSGPNQRKRLGGRKKDEWVQYDMPSNCKGLLPHEKPSEEAASTASPVTKHTGDSILALLDSGHKESLLQPTKAADWTPVAGGVDNKGDRFSSGEGLTGAKLDGDLSQGGIPVDAAN